MAEIRKQRPIRTGLNEAPIIPGTLRDREQKTNTSKPSAGRRLFNWFKESRTAKVIAAVTLGAAISQTPAGKEATQKIVEGAENTTSTIVTTIDNHLFGPHAENNSWATKAIKRVKGETPLENGEHFTEEMIVKTDEPLQTEVDVYPFNSDVAGGTPVVPIGKIPVGTELNHVLITMGHMPNTVDLQENWGVVACDIITSLIKDRNGNPIDNLVENYPVCAIPISNLQKIDSTNYQK